MAPTRGEMRIHLGLVLALLICVPLFFIELSRALGGNSLSWAYVFEWPLLAGYAIYMWHSLLRQERGEVPAPKRASKARDEVDDAALREWNAYLAKVHGTPHDDQVPEDH
jgi:hypothetical protein